MKTYNYFYSEGSSGHVPKIVLLKTPFFASNWFLEKKETEKLIGLSFYANVLSFRLLCFFGRFLPKSPPQFEVRKRSRNQTGVLVFFFPWLQNFIVDETLKNAPPVYEMKIYSLWFGVVLGVVTWILRKVNSNWNKNSNEFPVEINYLRGKLSSLTTGENKYHGWNSWKNLRELWWK